ncbi:hypothetical protein [Lentzea sp. NPDC051838]|uniref:hypothetical protein n=1 Tax=Lentzea sp. NPDC051838 TaxID=3154849 RepID=UPI0034305430
MAPRNHEKRSPARQRDPVVLARLARTRMRAKIPLPQEAFVGRVNHHHAFLPRTMPARIDQAVAKLDEITGVGLTAVHVMIAEIGIARRRGKKKAIVAIGRSILVIVWHLLSDPDARYHNLGPDFCDKRISPDRKKRNRIRQLEALGYQVTLTLAA